MIPFKKLELVKQKEKLTPVQELQKKYALEGLNDPFGEVFGRIYIDGPEFEDLPF